MARLNEVEMRSMQSRWRRLSQRYLEMPRLARLLRRAGMSPRGGRILEVGCGSGYGLWLLGERYRPRRLVGFDLMPEQIALARARAVPGAEVRVGDATRIEEPDATFDAVFVFGILHHVPRWREALGEIARVLVPGGALAIEEIEGRYVDLEDRYLGTSHPREARFDWPTFRSELERAGFAIEGESALLFDAARAFVARRRADAP